MNCQLFLIFALCIIIINCKTIIVAHRGDSVAAPENTLPAFALGFSNGADSFETDLRTSSDGYIVLMHDYTIDRTTNCSNSVPITQCRCGPVNDLTLAALKTCDAGIKFGEQWAGTPIPTFEESVELASLFSGMIVMDLKEDDQTGGLLGAQIEPIVTEYGMSSLVTASCWNYDQIANMNEYLTMSAKQYLGHAPLSYNNKYFEEQLSAGINGFSLAFQSLTSSFVLDSHLRLLPIFSWTINDEEDMETAISMGIDGIITDDVSLAYSVINS